MAGPQMIEDITVQHQIIDLKCPPINPAPPSLTSLSVPRSHIHTITIPNHVRSPRTKLAWS